MLIRLTQANSLGGKLSPMIINTDLVEAVRPEPDGVTALEMASGHTRWITESVEEYWKLAKP
jgi:uncharacterized protein YlzI (FlbEa/FlbD family)